MISPERDVSQAATPSHFYAILSVPRSGSTLLARGIEASGSLGVPHEYLNQNAIAAWAKLNNLSEIDLNAYLLDMKERRTLEMVGLG